MNIAKTRDVLIFMSKIAKSKETYMFLQNIAHTQAQAKLSRGRFLPRFGITGTPCHVTTCGMPLTAIILQCLHSFFALLLL